MGWGYANVWLQNPRCESSLHCQIFGPSTACAVFWWTTFDGNLLKKILFEYTLTWESNEHRLFVAGLPRVSCLSSSLWLNVWTVGNETTYEVLGMFIDANTCSFLLGSRLNVFWIRSFRHFHRVAAIAIQLVLCQFMSIVQYFLPLVLSCLSWEDSFRSGWRAPPTHQQ